MSLTLKEIQAQISKILKIKKYKLKKSKINGVKKIA